MKRPILLGTASLKALGFFVALGVMAHASLPYLPLTGPVPMRVQAARVPAHPMVKFAGNSNTNGAPAESVAASMANTNQTALANAEMSQSLTGFGSGDKSPDAVNSAIFTLTTPDLLGISPQALAIYFHPVQRGTNTVVPDGLLPISFVPPLPAPAQKSSQAEYRVE